MTTLKFGSTFNREFALTIVYWTVATKMHNKVHVLYISTEHNLIKKMSILPRTRETCLIEIWQPEVGASSKILTMQYLKQTESLYIGNKMLLPRNSFIYRSANISK